MKINIQNSVQSSNHPKSATTKYNQKKINPIIYNFPTHQNLSVIGSQQKIKINRHEPDSSKYIKQYEAELNKIEQFTKGKFQQNQHINEEMLQILKAENKNLKQQNIFLVNKIREMNEKQKHTKQLKQKLEQQKKRINLLNQENQALKTYVFELTQLINNKAESIQIKLQHLFNETEHSASHKLSTVNPIQLDDVYTKRKSETATHSLVSQQVQQLNSKFEQLLSSCKSQQEKQKRKQIRKKLVQLTYKMSELRKQCN